MMDALGRPDEIHHGAFDGSTPIAESPTNPHPPRGPKTATNFTHIRNSINAAVGQQCCIGCWARHEGRGGERKN